MNKDIYQQIIFLRDHKSFNKRQNFELLIREIENWNEKPQIINTGINKFPSSNFRYHTDIYHIQSNAVNKSNSIIEKQWDIFKQVILSAKDNKLIGVFCSLFKVSDKITEEAVELNKNGKIIFIISGQDWDDLLILDIRFSVFLNYLKLLSKSKHSPSLDSINNIKDWNGDNQSILKTFIDSSSKLSGTFLRRFKHRYHDEIYVKRKIEDKIESYINSFHPHILKRNKHSDTFKQIIIIRDTSGSGKTTFSVDLASNNNKLSIGATASQDSIDGIMDKFFDLNNYPNYGIEELYAINKPLILVIDSLDEVPSATQINKKREIKSLLKRIGELNHIAKNNQFSFFPIVVLFSVREEYWRVWESDFEGRLDVAIVKKNLSNFNEEEIDIAISNYSKAYSFNIINQINAHARDILSVPINLEIFSEANHYEGDIVIEEIWEGKILANYFRCKEESLSKHYIEGYSNDYFYNLLGHLAFSLISNKRIFFSKNDYDAIIAREIPNLSGYKDPILTNLKSEQIIQNDPEDSSKYRFRYNRFLEYLVAMHIIQHIIKTSDFKYIDSAINIIYASKIISIYAVLNNIKHVAGTQDIEIETKIIDYYSQSEKFLNHLLPEYRGQLSRGEEIDDQSIKNIITKNFTQSSSSSWDIFFIIAAKNTNSTKENILSCFEIAWDSNQDHFFRWKLINKLGFRLLLIEERVLLKLIKNGIAREWEEYLGKIIEDKLNISFLELWDQIRGETALKKTLRKIQSEWSYVDRLLDLIHRGENYVLGDVLSDIKSSKKYIILEPAKKFQISKLDSNEQKLVEEYVKTIQDSFITFHDPTTLYGYQMKHLSNDAYDYINNFLEPIFKDKHGEEQLPFINYLVSRLPESKGVLRVVLDNPRLDYTVNEKDKEGITLFQQIIRSNYDNKIELLLTIFKQGYIKDKKDEDLVSHAIKNLEKFNTKELEDILIGGCFLKIKDKNRYIELNEIYREICFLLSLKYRTIIYFRFKQMVQVANNALEHYQDFGNFLLNGLQHYNHFEELSQKESFLKKVQSYNVNSSTKLHKYRKVLYDIFPELF